MHKIYNPSVSPLYNNRNSTIYFMCFVWLLYVYGCVQVTSMQMDGYVGGYRNFHNSRVLSQQYGTIPNGLNCSIQPIPNTQTTLTLGTCQSQLYYLPIQIGTPPQSLNLQIDTSTNILWVQSTSINPTSGLGFNATASTTFVNSSKPYSAAYFNGGRIEGSFGVDFVGIGGSGGAGGTGVNVSMSFVVVGEMVGVGLGEGVDGVIGLGHAGVGVIPNLFDLAYLQSQISTNTFTLSLQPQPQPTLLYNTPTPPPTTLSTPSLSNPQYWQLQLIGVMAGLYDFTSYAPTIAVIDSGTSFLYFNSQLAQAFIRQFLGNGVCSFGGVVVCNEAVMGVLPNITFIFTGVAVQITPTDYSICTPSPSPSPTPTLTCTIQIYQITTTPSQILLGNTLLNKYTTTFSKQEQSVGFAGNTRKVVCFGCGDVFVVVEICMVGIVGVGVLGFGGLVGFGVVRDRKVEREWKGEGDTDGVGKDGVPMLRQRMTQLIDVEKLPKSD